MEVRASSFKSSTHASGADIAPATDPAQVLPGGGFERIEAMIARDIPVELQTSARGLLRSVIGKVAVAEHFDAFCGQAFSKPDWAAVASPLIAELFDHDEDQLAELARIPDLVIEMGSGQATVTCMVASRWAARGETHRLSRLAESIVASHASKNACAVEVMLALAATLAVTRFSKAEQLFNAALPLVGEEHQEALADARRWLSAGRVVCSASQEERDFWDVRLRKPRASWTWQTKEERAALDTLSERLSPDTEGVEVFKAVVPTCWWDLAMKSAQQVEKLSAVVRTKPFVERKEPSVTPRANFDFLAPERTHSQAERPLHPQAGSHARFVLGWVCGAMAMAITALLLPVEVTNRVLNSFRGASARPTAPIGPEHSSADVMLKTAAEKKAWREENLTRIASEMAQYSSLHASVKAGRWSDIEPVLTGNGEELPTDSPQHLKMLVWLHLDPPQDMEIRSHVSKLLLDKMKADAITLWEELSYPGSVNEESLKQAAEQALSDASFQWSADEKRRLLSLAAAGSEVGKVSAAVTKP